jgi:hypothetical protein
MEKQTWWQRLTGTRALADDKPVQAEGGPKPVVVHVTPLGSSGSLNWAGYPSEEYLSTLTGTGAAEVFDKMRRSESQVKMVTAAVMHPILGASWEVEPGAENDPVAEMHAKFCEHILFSDMDKPWPKFLREVLSFIVFGYSLFERTHKIVTDHPKWGTYVGIRAFGFRSQKTLERWHLDKTTGKLLYVEQYAYGDLSRTVKIPAEFLTIFTLDKEGDNYEGISPLRAVYGAWLRKQEYLKLQAIGIEKFAVPTPIGKIPAGKQDSPEAENFKEALRIYTSHQSNYITMPTGDWAIDFSDNDFDPAKVQVAIDAEDRNIVKGFMANFLELGMSTAGGSWALSFDQSDFFLSTLEHIAEIIAEEITATAIREVIDLKFGPQPVYPRLKCRGISDDAGAELATALKTLADGKIIIPDDQLEENVRRRFKLPKRSMDGQREVTQPAAPGGFGFTEKLEKLKARRPDLVAKGLLGEMPDFAFNRIRLAEVEAKAQIGEGGKTLKELMQEQLREIGQDAVTKIKRRLDQATPAQRANARAGVSLGGGVAYRQALTETLAGIAGLALEKARKEVPRKSGVRLGGEENGIKLASKVWPVSIDDLPTSLAAKIRKRAQLLTDTQLADLEKAIFFSFDSSVASTDSAAIIAKDIEENLEDYVTGPSVQAAAGNTAATMVNEARNAFFFEPEVLEEIESFTFVNGDPVSPVCQELAGTTFAKDDPEAARYFPPLHHNCKSYIVANLVGGKRNPKIDDGGLVPSKANQKYVTLSEADQCCGSQHG